MTDNRQPSILTSHLRALTSPAQLAARQAREVDLAFQRVDERFVWITDRGVRVGLLDLDEYTLEWVAPHPGQPPAWPAEIPPLYHAPTYQGGRIILQWWVWYKWGPRRAPDAQFGWLYLGVEGPGDAWFDDVGNEWVGQGK